MGDLRSLVPLLPVLLPLVGKLLLMIPFVPNKAIPFANAIVATAAKYWFLAGFGVLGETADNAGSGGQVFAAGFFGEIGRAGLSLAWGCLDSAAAHFFYEGERAKSKLLGKLSWWEQGKASIYGKKG